MQTNHAPKLGFSVSNTTSTRGHESRADSDARGHSSITGALNTRLVVEHALKNQSSSLTALPYLDDWSLWWDS